VRGARNEVRVGNFSFYAGGGRALPEWEEAARQLLDQGQPFLAYDIARTGLGQFPGSLTLTRYAAMALMRTGALDEAVRLLEPLCPEPQPDDATLRGLFESLRDVLSALSSQPPGEPPSAAARSSLSRLIRDVNDAGLIQPAGSTDEESLGLLASAYKEIWKRTQDPADGRRARDAYLRAFEATRGYWTGINAATLSRLTGDAAAAQTLASNVLALCRAAFTGVDAKSEEAFWVRATMGEACLLLGHTSDAERHYQEAMALPDVKPASVVSALRQLRLMRKHDARLVPDAIIRHLPSPTVVVFSGHMLDKPDRPIPRFPANRAGDLAREIRIQLEELKARVGYCSAACGGDILFAEAMFERGAEVHVLLPFHVDDFIRESVAFAGEAWKQRFQSVLRLAHSVRYVTEEQHLGADVLFRFAADVLNGYAEMHAQTLETRPYLLAAVDETSPLKEGGALDVAARWHSPDWLRIIPIDEIRDGRPFTVRKTLQAPAPQTPDVARTTSLPPARQRVVRALLFADVVGYSKLDEEHTPFYFEEFLRRVADGLAHAGRPELVNTWGDAIFAVMPGAIAMVEYALALQDVVCATDWSAIETSSPLPDRFTVRIALHAGPVFAATDPIAGRPNFYGAHVNRAARIEPVTLPGHIYASDQFVALLTAEQVMREHEHERAGTRYERPFVTEYVGMVALAKAFGMQAVHEVRRA